jgi:type IV pilus assembly protein PilO
MNRLKLSKAIDPVFQKIGGLSRLYRILICVATVVVLVAAFGFLLYKPKLDSMTRLKSDITTTEQRLERVKRSAQEYDTYKAKMDEARAQFEIVSRELPLTEEIPSLLTSISQAGNAAGLKFLLFQPQAENRKDFYAEIPVRMELSGTYHELGNFFDRLARLSRIVNIDNCSTQRAGSDLRISCTAITYRFVGEKEQAPQKASKK